MANAAQGDEITLVCFEGSSNKFWRIQRRGLVVFTSFGRHGTEGQNRQKSFASRQAADHYIAQKMEEKYRKGYEHPAAEHVKKMGIDFGAAIDDLDGLLDDI